MTRLLRHFLVFASCALGISMASAQMRAQMRVLVDQVGYETKAPKVGLISAAPTDHPAQFTLIEDETGKVVFTGAPQAEGKVDRWGDRVYWKADFSSFQTPGHYILRIADGDTSALSCAFQIDDNLLERKTLSNVIFYFKGQRASGALDRADSHLKLPDGPGAVDVHGGWYDATGDYGIHFSQLNLTSYFNNQQVPLVAWTLLAGYDTLKARNDDNFSEYERRMLDEGLFGADFLVRMKRPQGSFFQSIDGPGVKKLPQDRKIGDLNWKLTVKTKADQLNEKEPPAEGPHSHEVSFRSGGGVAIAALALASTMPEDGDFPRARYLQAAEEAFAFLQAHNRELLNDHAENILDDYCALLAATELYGATHKQSYLLAADQRADSLMARLTTRDAFRDYWRADNGTRPFFHPSDAGLPVVSLVRYATVASAANRKKTLDAVKRSLEFELATTREVNNPFGYARQLVRMGNGDVRTAFFFPHDTEAAPWWQGENARIASLAAAARMAAPLYGDDPSFQSALQNYAEDQLHWILGRNPFDSSMLIGSGHGNIPYMFFRSYKYTSAPGAVINGITAGLNDEDGIAYNEGFAQTGKDDDWRWAEEWLPHAAWYLYAVSLPHR
ncbi:MAG TPA: glycoside hydrolase family 9 protein [Acidobacteriaceae bacterium]